VVLTSKPYIQHALAKRGNAIDVIKELQLINPQKHIWVIGGADLLMETKDICEEMWIAHRKGSYYTDVRVDMNKYLLGTRITSSMPNQTRTINWCVYKHFFRPL
jgi:dihydrofolate reductase